MPPKSVPLSSIVRTTEDEDLLKYDDVNLAKIAKFIGQDSLDQVLAGYKSKQSFTIADVLKRLGISVKELDVNPSAVLGKE
jgi:hypothetical protein